MTAKNLAVETIGATLIMSEGQAQSFARATYSYIRAYCEENREAYLRWKQEQEGGDRYVG